MCTIHDKKSAIAELCVSIIQKVTYSKGAVMPWHSLHAVLSQPPKNIDYPKDAAIEKVVLA